MNQYIIVYGEILWDVLESGRVLGGAPTNCAFRLSELGAEVKLVSRVGDDSLGKEALSFLKEKNLNTDYVQTDKIYPTGTVPVQLSPNGDASYDIIKDVAYDYTECPESLFANQKPEDQCSLIYFGTLIQRSPIARKSLYQLLEETPKAKKVVDINLRKECYSLETVKNSFIFADIVKLNNDEVIEISTLMSFGNLNDQQFSQKLIKDFNIECVVVTRGKDGCICVSSDGTIAEISGQSVQVVDTIGAGDAFTAGFIAHYLKNKSYKECCEQGNILGAKVAQTNGGMSRL